MWTLRLRGPKGKGATVQIRPEALLCELCDLAETQLAIKGGKNLHLTLRSGFPPRVVDFLPDDAVQVKFANNDTIVVDTAAPNAEPRQAAATTSTPPKGRAATRGVAASVAKATAKAKANANAKANLKAPVGGVHTLHGAKPKAPPTSQKRKERSDGVRLGVSLEEESIVVDPAQIDESDEAAPKYRRTHALQLTSKDDIGTQLAEAVSGQSNGRVGKFFRAATKSAVEHQYEMTLANARLKAALSKQFEIQTVQPAASHTVGSNDGEDAPLSGDVRVKFKESMRKWKEETVTMLQPIELQAALKYILISGGETGREMLKPFNMAQVSPRVFWNIARLYDGDVEAGLAALVPDEDWSYLDTRSRQMSKKAIEAKANEEVYKQWKQKGPAQAETPAASRHTTAVSTTTTEEVIEIKSDDKDKEASATSDQQLQQAVEYAEQAEKRSLREAMARAAVTRVDARARANEVSAALRERANSGAVSQPSSIPERDPDGTESDDDQDVEKTTTVYCDACNKARILTLAEAAVVGAESAAEWTCARLVAVQRDGACEAVDDEVEQVAGATLARLLSSVNIHTRHDLANASLLTVLHGLSHPLHPTYAEIKTKLEEIIDEARLDEVNDAMDEIVGATGSGELVGLLEMQKLGTPADLAETPADLVVAAIASRMRNVDVAMVNKWQQHAREKIARCPWMGEWRTI